jgi:hypothetical protein
MPELVEPGLLQHRQVLGDHDLPVQLRQSGLPRGKCNGNFPLLLSSLRPRRDDDAVGLSDRSREGRAVALDERVCALLLGVDGVGRGLQLLADQRQLRGRLGRFLLIRDRIAVAQCRDLLPQPDVLALQGSNVAARLLMKLPEVVFQLSDPVLQRRVVALGITQGPPGTEQAGCPAARLGCGCRANRRQGHGGVCRRPSSCARDRTDDLVGGRIGPPM